MINMELPSVVKSPLICHDCSRWKTFWDGKFTGEEKFTLGEFIAVNMKIVVVAMLGNTDRSKIVIST